MQVSWSCQLKKTWSVDDSFTVTINQPQYGAKFACGAEVPCSGSATDQDRWTTEDGGGGPLGDDIAWYAWEADGGAWKNGVSTGPNVTWIAPDQPGLYQITLRADDVDGLPAGDEGSRNDDPGSASVTVKVIGGPIHADDVCGKKLVLYNPAANSPQESFSAAPNQPAGTTYNWTIDQGDDKAEIVGSTTSATCWVRAKAASGAGNDVRMKLTYSNSGTSTDAYLTTTVQRPTGLVRQDLGYTVQQCAPVAYVERRFLDTVYDQLGQATAWAWWDESWDTQMQQRDESTDCNGQVLDLWINGFDGYCDLRGRLLSGTQTVTVSGWGCFLRYYREDWDGFPPSILWWNPGCP